mgnify:FL=1
MSEEAVNQTQEINEEVSTSEEDASKANLMSFDDLDNLTDNRSDEELLNEAKKLSEEKGEKNEPQSKAESKGPEKTVNAKEAKEEADAEEMEDAIEEYKKLLGKFNDQ